MAVTKACLGADVLRPRYLRGCLLALGHPDAQFYEPVWSASILDSLVSALTLQGYPASIAGQVVASMRLGWPDSEVTPSETLIAHLEGDFASTDAALIATAVAGDADTLVTQHPGDFAGFDVLSNLVPLSADAFLNEVFFPDRARVTQVLTRFVATLKSRLSFRDFLGGLLTANVDSFPYQLTSYRTIYDLEALTDEWRAAI